MDDNIGDIGSAITAGLAARAAEPEAGEADSRAHEEVCANCAIPLIGPHCHFCGQKGHVHRSIAAFGHDLVHGVLHLDGKFWRTLPLLIWRPGQLTRRYAEGERAKFVSPLAMFLFAVFLMFAVLAIYGLSLNNLDVSLKNAAETGIGRARGDIDRELAEARAARTAAPAEDPANGAAIETVAEIDARIAGLEADRVRLQQAPDLSEFTFIGDRIRTGWPRLDQGIEKLNDNPSLALYKLQSNGYKFSWLLIPLSVPFVWILFFWTRRYRLYDHTVFVTYSLAFMSLLAVALTVAGFVGFAAPVIAPAGVFIPPIHMFAQLKGTYRLHWASALLRTFLLVNFCAITATIFFMLLLGIGALG